MVLWFIPTGLPYVRVKLEVWVFFLKKKILWAFVLYIIKLDWYKPYGFLFSGQS